MIKRIKNLAIIISSIAIIPRQSFGQTIDFGQGSSADVFDALKNIATFMFQIATPLFVISILIAAFLMLFSAGDPEKFGKGRKLIIYSTIAYAIIIVSWGLPSLIDSIIISP